MFCYWLKEFYQEISNKLKDRAKKATKKCIIAISRAMVYTHCLGNTGDDEIRINQLKFIHVDNHHGDYEIENSLNESLIGLSNYEQELQLYEREMKVFRRMLERDKRKVHQFKELKAQGLDPTLTMKSERGIKIILLTFLLFLIIFLDFRRRRGRKCLGWR